MKNLHEPATKGNHHIEANKLSFENPVHAGFGQEAQGQGVNHALAAMLSARTNNLGNGHGVAQ